MPSEPAGRVTLESLAAARGAIPLTFKYDAALPITAQREVITELLRRRQVLIVAGDTGSGKSTQLPQYCLEQGRGIEALIAHTQPRRLAARSLAARIAEEVGQPVGRSVGFRVRFADQVSAATRLVLMTDGLLLAEIAKDPLLRRYDTLIVDEAHERTLNVDLLLGVIKRILPRRPELKLIVTSATLDVERIARFFDEAPIVTVSGRAHPIEVRYREMPGDVEDPDLAVAVLAAYREIAAEPGPIGRGDVLVFLPGEREIRDVGELLERELAPQVEVLALYSRLSWDEQKRVFQPASRQRIVLATNVAETSITVPGVRAVIDSGLARISRYSPRNRLQRLPIEPISRAGAEQRKGRCGRVGPGVCVRLYSEAEFESRAAFTEPEVLRTNLAALLLRLAADGLGQAENFPFIDAPDARTLNDGYRLLQELQALDAERRITRRGRAMARLPLDPRLARALLESQRFRASAELLAIVAGLSVPDVRLGNGDDAAPKAVFDGVKSEFTAMFKLWRAYRKAREGPRRELRRWCKERKLSLLRLSEWDDVYAQLLDRAAELSIVPQRQPASYTGVHRSLLAGFCTMVGTRGENGYVGTRGVHFHVFPGSPLAKRRPRWLMAANIIETSRVFARQVAEIEPQWIETAASHLLKREYLEPDWDDEREEVVARERVSVLGLVLSSNRWVNYGPIAPEESRNIFAREALVFRRLRRRPDWLLANDASIRAAEQMEERLRTRGLLRDSEAFVDFYSRALPRQVSSAATLEYFTRHLPEAERLALALDEKQIFAHLPEPAALAQFPETAQVDALAIPVEYRFAPGEERDGASLGLPLLAVPGLTRPALDAAVPGFTEPRIEALLRSLPKDARRNLIPIAETAAAFLASLRAGAGAGAEAGASAGGAADALSLKAWLSEQRGIPEPLLRFDLTTVPAHLTPHLTVITDGKVLARGETPAELRRRCAAAARAELDRRAQSAYPQFPAWRRFELDELPERVDLALEQGAITVYPTLGGPGRPLAVHYEWSAAEARRSWQRGAADLARILLERQARSLALEIAADGALMLAAAPYSPRDADLPQAHAVGVVDALLHLTFRRACFGDSDAPRTRDAYLQAVDQGRARLHRCQEEIRAEAAGWFALAREVRRAQGEPRNTPSAEAADETREHLVQLLRPDSLCGVPVDRLRQLPRYLRAEERRWQRGAARGGESPHILREIRHWSSRRRELEAKFDAELRFIPELEDFRGWLEEYRVSLYAQELKTPGPVSAARLEQRAAEIDAWLAR